MRNGKNKQGATSAVKGLGLKPRKRLKPRPYQGNFAVGAEMKLANALKMPHEAKVKGAISVNGGRTLFNKDMPLEVDPRYLEFKRLFMKGATIEEASDAVGYAHDTGRNLARRIGTNMERELRRQGFDEEKIAKKFVKLVEAQTVKWNPVTQDWDTFADGRLQLDALVEAAAHLGIQKAAAAGGGPINVDKAVFVVQSSIPRPQRQLAEPLAEPLTEDR